MMSFGTINVHHQQQFRDYYVFHFLVCSFFYGREIGVTIIVYTSLFVCRYHSFYPWHSGGDYMHLCSERDLQMLPWIREFK